MNIVRLMLLSRQMKNRRHGKNNMVTGIPPLTFTANKTGLLKNYRIYGNTETKTRSYSGSAPLSFPIVDGAVSNYRIYGNTENGESVGERTKNLLDINNLRSGAYAFVDGVYTPNSPGYLCTQKIPCEGNTTYVFSFDDDIRLAGFIWYDENDTYISSKNKSWNETEIDRVLSAVSPINAAYLAMDYASRNSQDPPPMTNAQIEQNTDKSSYEPYGYKISITNNNENANIYLDEPLTKQGNNADYIDYAEQKRYNADGTSEDVSLPVLPAQSSTNSFSVGTEVQPSNITVDVDELVNVGDKTANLFDMNDYNPDYVTVNEDGSFYIQSLTWAFSCKVETGKTYFLSWEEYYTDQISSQLSIAAKAGYHVGYSQPCYRVTLKSSPPNVWHKQHAVFTATDDYLSIDGYNTYIRNIMLVEGSTAMNYEHYGYKIPVTLTADSAETTDIYLNTPLAKSGDIADYIDYAAQKRRNSDGTESSVTLPEIAVAVGTNTLTVGTEVQPSRVELTGRIKEAQTNGSGNT